MFKMYQGCEVMNGLNIMIICRVNFNILKKTFMYIFAFYIIPWHWNCICCRCQKGIYFQVDLRIPVDDIIIIPANDLVTPGFDIDCVEYCVPCRDRVKILEIFQNEAMLWKFPQDHTTPASNATSGDIVTTLASVATVAVAHPTSRRRWLQIAGITVCHFTSAARTWAVDSVCVGIVAGSSARRSQSDGRNQKTTCKFTIT